MSNEEWLNWITVILLAFGVAAYVWKVWTQRHGHVAITMQKGMEKVTVEGLPPEQAVKEVQRLADQMWLHRLRLPEETGW